MRRAKPKRRFAGSYGSLGLVLVVVAVALAILPQQDGGIGGWFLPWGVITALLGLFFLLPFVHNEDDPLYRNWAVRLLGGVGAAAAARRLCRRQCLGRLPGQPRRRLLVARPALSMGDDRPARREQRQGYRLAWALGALGLLAFLVALGRSIAPTDFGVGPQVFSAVRIAPDGCRRRLRLMALALVSDNRLIVLTRRELASYFYSPIAYIVLFGLTAVGWWTYFNFSGRLFLLADRSSPIQEPIVRNFFIDFFPVMSVIFVVPIITMKLLSEERRSGTLEVLLTAPVGEFQVVFSKFLAGLIYYLFLWVPWGLFLVALRVEGGREFDYRPLLSFGVVLVRPAPLSLRWACSSRR